MTEEEINQKIEEFHKDHVDFISKRLMEEGEVEPMITVLALNEETQKMGIVLAPIFGDFDDIPKIKIIEKIVPKLFEQIQSEKLKPYCFSFSSEVAIRKSKIKKSDMEKGLDNWEKLPKAEGLMVSFETKDATITELFYMDRIGKVVNSEGELIDQIKLSPVEEFKTSDTTQIEGKFANIFKKYL